MAISILSVRVGSEIRCCNGTFLSRKTDPFRSEQIRKPVFGVVYRVREVVETQDGPGLRLKEIINEKFLHDKGGLQEPAFSLDRFDLVSY